MNNSDGKKVRASGRAHRTGFHSKLGVESELPVDVHGKNLLVYRMVRASSKPGIKREAVFKPEKSKKIYAYYVLASDPSKIVREDAQGKTAIGQLANGRFRTLKSRPF